MLGIDSNVLIRFLTKDDEAQAQRALAILTSCTAKKPGFISTIVAVEVFWTRRLGYGYSRQEICSAFAPLLHLEEICFEHLQAVQYACHLYQTGRADFADALLGRIGKLAGCDVTSTFDQKAAALADFTEI